MKEIDEYFKLQQEIYDLFQYEEQWRVYPLDDRRDVWWSIEGNTVWWSEKKENHQQLIDQEYDYDDIPNDDVYSGEIRGSRHLDKSIYEDAEKKFTMIIVDTNTDFNVFLMIFDNDKRLKSIDTDDIEDFDDSDDE